MTHMRQFSEDEGTFESDWKPSFKTCDCGAQTVQFRVWESLDGGYEDYKYRCTTCGRTWWVDGIDS